MNLVKSALAALALTFSLTACGPSVCSGTNCACPQGATCAYDTCNSGTANCQFACGAEATCTGSCGANCNVSCAGKSCTHSVGAGANVACTAGTCTITCDGTCLATAAGGTLELTCKTGTKTAAGCN